LPVKAQTNKSAKPVKFSGAKPPAAAGSGHTLTAKHVSGGGSFPRKQPSWSPSLEVAGDVALS